MKLHWSIPVATAGAILGGALYFSVPAHADPPNTRDMAIEAAFCHDIRNNPTVAGVREAARQMVRIYGDTDTAADVATAAVTDVCPDLRPVLLAAIESPSWTGGATV